METLFEFVRAKYEQDSAFEGHISRDFAPQHGLCCGAVILDLQ